MSLTLIVSVLSGLVGVPLVNRLKAAFGWGGDRVELLAAAVSGGLALVALGAACILPVDGLACVLPLTADTIFAAVGVAY